MYLAAAGSVVWTVYRAIYTSVRVMKSNPTVAWLNSEQRVLRASAQSPRSLASPAMEHWGTCPPRLPTVYFFLVTTDRAAQTLTFDYVVAYPERIYSFVNVYCMNLIIVVPHVQNALYFRQKVRALFILAHFMMWTLKIDNKRTFQRTLFSSNSARTLTNFIFAMNARNNYEFNNILRV